MSYVTQKLWISFIGFILVVSFTCFSQTSQTTGKILFLTFSMKNDGTIALKNSQITSGTLKKRNNSNAGDLLYEVTSIGKTIVAQGVLQSPLVRYYDYIDPNNPTVLKGGMIIDSIAEFTVRVCYDDSLSKISFFKKSDSASAGLAKRHATETFPKGKFLGSFIIPKQGGRN